MAILPAQGVPPPEATMLAAAEALAAGLVLGIPTDTVYGLAVNPFVTGAADRVFAAKRRPRDVALPVLVADVEQALALSAAVPQVALDLMERYWPGPLTLVLPRRPGLPADLGTDEATVGVRCPDHPVPRSLCARAGPMATTSANLHGEPTPLTAAEVAAVFGEAVAHVLDGGPCAGAPSTVVDCTAPSLRILRQGRLARAEIEAAVGAVL